MTESEWLSATDPTKMLEWVRHADRLSERKARLFACAAATCVVLALICEGVGRWVACWGRRERGSHPCQSQRG